MPSLVAAVVAQLSNDALVANLNARQRELDEWAALKFDVEKAGEFAKDRLVVAALRAEYRNRTGERI